MTAAPVISRKGRPRATHCKYGHPYTPENTYIDGHGARSCRTCTRLHQARRAAAGSHKRRAKRLAVACPHGHPYTPENTSYLANGTRRCRQCMRTRRKQYAARTRATAIHYVMVDDEPMVNLIGAITQQAIADYTCGEGADYDSAREFLDYSGLVRRDGSIRRPS